MKAAGYVLETPERLSLAQKAIRIAQVPFTHDGVHPSSSRNARGLDFRP